ncbi:aldehyde ferredoxin oxidoreductase family protein [Natronorubrum thiooxidans]|uniref:Aldehyde:ferredoxin oxidoreductase n=1 Tax=Natronorubrum thiooxidans TaxID=308853 RepID=A0A1N7H6V1_9EURY|nr:aldehyde ferredoxin oxidoreductase C-terminal domain-containing protein [Natronorubrum thiooxidans]SIS20607.1 aldehyde:ferredoxin oxidoreductase [Natronorubrum thiooxidans]
MLHAAGPLLTVDVSTQTSERTAIDTVLERFIGGRGVGTALAHERVPFDADPFGPENSLFFTTGPMQASTMSFTGRMNCTGISPQTDRLLSSNAGGFMSRNFAATGNAAVEITGQSDELLIVHVTDGGVEFEAVPELEDATVPEVTTYIDETHGLSSEHVACIGPAGERRVRFASIMTTESRAFGRGGLGAVLGAKNVKAITFDGDSSPDLEVPSIQMDVHRDAATSDHIMKRQGTTSVTDLANEVEALPTRYFSELSFEGVEGINGDAVEDRKYTRGTCSACAFACKLPTKDDERGVETEGPEYETVMSFGSNCAVDDIVDVMQSNELCDRYGMDTITCGNVVAAYLASEDEFGNVELIHDLVADIAHRDGVGDRLAEGIERFHEDLEVENWTVKGLDFAAHDGRTLHGQGLSYAVANRGADHMFSTMYAWEYPLVDADDALEPTGLEGKPAVVIEQENARALEDCGIVCRFSRSFMTPDRFEGLFDAEYESLLEVGSRVVTLERHFNSRRGFDRDDDSLPYDLPGFENALDEYYDHRGWARDGTVGTSHATEILADD